VYNNLLFGLFVRIVVYVSFSICTNLCTSACYIKHILEQQVDGENLCIIKMIFIVLYTCWRITSVIFFFFFTRSRKSVKYFSYSYVDATIFNFSSLFSIYHYFLYVWQVLVFMFKKGCMMNL